MLLSVCRAVGRSRGISKVRSSVTSVIQVNGNKIDKNKYFNTRVRINTRGVEGNERRY